MKSISFITNSLRETVFLGEKIGMILKPGDIIALSGELGSGKTWFTKGIALGLDIPPEEVTSPSFILVNEYEGRFKLFHIDAYRLKNKEDFFSAGLDEYFYKDDGIVVMEWANKWPELLDENVIIIRIEILDENKRRITISGEHERAIEVIESLVSVFHIKNNGAYFSSGQ